MTDEPKKYYSDVRIELNKTWNTSHIYINDIEVPVESIEIKFDGTSKPHSPLLRVKLGLHLDLLKYALKNASIEVSEKESDDFGRMFELLVTPRDEELLEEEQT